MPFSEHTKLKAKRQSHFRCVVCRQPFVEIHHIIPQADGGSDLIDNACPLCARCHDVIGPNREKRKQLREMRDFWYELCKKSELNPSMVMLDELYQSLLMAEDERSQIMMKLEKLVDNLEAEEEKEITFFIAEFLSKFKIPIIKTTLRLADRAPYKLRKSEIEIRYLDSKGSRVRIRKLQDIEVFSDGIDGMWDRGITVDAEAPNSGVDEASIMTSIGEITDIQRIGSNWNIKNEFNKSFNKGQTFQREFSYILIDAYKRQTEDFIMTISRLVDKAVIRVVLPKSDKVLNCSGTIAIGDYSIQTEQNPPKMVADGNEVIWRINEPVLGERYHLQWTRS